MLLPAVVAAHPLGNFTINHYAEVRIEPDRVLLDVVIDQAEIPAFQSRQGFDLDADGSVSDEEIEAGRVAACDELAVDLELTVDDAELELRTIEAGLSFPPGVGGLSTMRLVCGFEAPLAGPIGADPVRVAFADLSVPESRSAGARSWSADPAVTLRFIRGRTARVEASPVALDGLPAGARRAPAGGPARRGRRDGRRSGARRHSTSRTRNRS